MTPDEKIAAVEGRYKSHRTVLSADALRRMYDGPLSAAAAREAACQYRARVRSLRRWIDVRGPYELNVNGWVLLTRSTFAMFVDGRQSDEATA